VRGVEMLIAASCVASVKLTVSLKFKPLVFWASFGQSSPGDPMQSARDSGWTRQVLKLNVAI
jgi:hypothetical protein